MEAPAWYDLASEARLEQQWQPLGAGLTTLLVLLCLALVLYETPGPPGFSPAIYLIGEVAVVVVAGVGAYGGIRALQSRRVVLRRIGVGARSIETESTRGGRIELKWADPTLELAVRDFASAGRREVDRRWSDLAAHEFRLSVAAGRHRFDWRINLLAARALLRQAHELGIPISGGKFQGGGEGSGFIENRIGPRVPAPDLVQSGELDRLLGSASP